MKILVDLTFVQNGDTSIGFTRVALTLLSNFMLQGLTSSLVILIDSSSESYFRMNYRACDIVVSKYSHSIINKLIDFRRKKEINSIVEQKGIQILFGPFISSASVTTNKCISIGILHDVQKFHFKKNTFFGFLYRIRMPSIIKSYDRIITISNSEKRHILKLFPDLKDKISVIHNGIEISNNEKKIEGGFFSKPYVLDINTLYEYKNPLTLVKAFYKIRSKIPHNLIFKGKRTEYWNNTVEPFVKEKGLQSRIFLLERFLCNEELSYLYRHADVFVSPSKMEGFGLTPVDAAIYKVPVICSNIDTLRETTMNLVSYFNPEDESALATLMLGIIKNPPKNLDFISNKLQDEYSVIQQAKRYINIFKQYEDNGCNSSL